MLEYKIVLWIVKDIPTGQNEWMFQTMGRVQQVDYFL